VDEAWELEIARIAALTGDQRKVFAAPDALSYI